MQTGGRDGLLHGGNVWEWTSDWYHRSASYAAADTTDPKAPELDAGSPSAAGATPRPAVVLYLHSSRACPAGAVSTDTRIPMRLLAGLIALRCADSSRSRRWSRPLLLRRPTSKPPRASLPSVWFGSAGGWSSNWVHVTVTTHRPSLGPGPLPKYVSTPPRAASLCMEQPCRGWVLPKRKAKVESFLMDKTEVTQAAYAGFVEKRAIDHHMSESWAEADGNWSDAPGLGR